MRIACQRASSLIVVNARLAAPRPLAAGAAPVRRSSSAAHQAFAAPFGTSFGASSFTAPLASAPRAPHLSRSVATAAGDGSSGSELWGQLLRKVATAVVGTGCFWCTEACYQQIKGVSSVVSGYAGGHVSDPSYEAVCGKKTGHIEVVKITFDPAVVSYKELLEVFFTIHDPTTPDRQGNDVGPQYASAIFYADAEQEAVAKEVREQVTKDKLWPNPIVTKLLPLATDGPAQFWSAEKYHWDYFNRNPGQPYCMFVVEPKVAKFRSKWAAKLIK
ncbi:peptide-methionine (S)-S-oxidereductase [Monoraphidium neglectum]|uniref:peptide-methionine (S)-S-oxide reductase n=1 Tax=Monoraphidium neglectum TaxID=145388 RepID=A0A0D2N308_9CHLO|nr:peptide-methionine (S)-S-oxidereductase [Monoraphidium neglectum]KIZ06767.1 peptide-methionine (S)-S-oxidereductase [Monoraphidium neglectum]|eukprot:XP_013905786.1 peptide-methionine (S)-S-oxidereductase [Monoraphidium neglectum]